MLEERKKEVPCHKSENMTMMDPYTYNFCWFNNPSTLDENQALAKCSSRGRQSPCHDVHFYWFAIGRSQFTRPSSLCTAILNTPEALNPCFIAYPDGT